MPKTDIEIYQDFKYAFENPYETSKKDNPIYHSDVGLYAVTQFANDYKTISARLYGMLKNPDSQSNKDLLKDLKTFAESVENNNSILSGVGLGQIAGVAGVAGLSIPVVGEILLVVSVLSGAFQIIDALNESAEARDKLRPLLINDSIPFQDLQTDFISVNAKNNILGSIEGFKKDRPKCISPSGSCAKEHSFYALTVNTFIAGVNSYVALIPAFESFEKFQVFAETLKNNPFGATTGSGITTTKAGFGFLSILVLIGIGIGFFKK